MIYLYICAGVLGLTLLGYLIVYNHIVRRRIQKERAEIMRLVKLAGLLDKEQDLIVNTVNELGNIMIDSVKEKENG